LGSVELLKQDVDWRTAGAALGGKQLNKNGREVRARCIRRNVFVLELLSSRVGGSGRNVQEYEATE
jgi:hypothetical protein